MCRVIRPAPPEHAVSRYRYYILARLLARKEASDRMRDKNDVLGSVQDGDEITLAQKLFITVAVVGELR